MFQFAFVIAGSVFLMLALMKYISDLHLWEKFKKKVLNMTFDEIIDTLIWSTLMSMLFWFVLTLSMRIVNEM